MTRSIEEIAAAHSIDVDDPCPAVVAGCLEGIVYTEVHELGRLVDDFVAALDATPPALAPQPYTIHAKLMEMAAKLETRLRPKTRLEVVP